MASEAELLVDVMAGRDMPCPVCDYNLRGIAQARCPECGAALRLEVGSENLVLGPWLVAIISLAMGAGFDGVVAVLMSFGLLVNPPVSPGETTVVLVILGVFITLAGLCAGGIAMLVARRKPWRRRRPRGQWRLAWIIFASVFVAHAAYGAALTRFIS
jgi:hypothetical protein